MNLSNHNPDNSSCPRNSSTYQTNCTCLPVPLQPLLEEHRYKEARRKTPHQQRVEEFMGKAGQEIPSQPTLPDEKTRLLRAKLILEEALETVDALGFCAEVLIQATSLSYQRMSKPIFVAHDRGPDLVQIADGCTDVSVVTIGTLSAFGIADVELLEEVDRSNLAKFALPKCAKCGNETEHLGDGKYSCNCGSTPLGGYQGPYRNEDGKWIKGPDWKLPDIEGILARQVPPNHHPYGIEPCCPFHTDTKMFDNGGGYYHCRFRTENGLCGYSLIPPEPSVEEDEEGVANPIRILSDAETALDRIGEQEIAKRVGRLTEQLLTEATVDRRVQICGGVQYDSGGLHLCPACKGPLSDEMMKKLFAGRIDTGYCPNCLNFFSQSDCQKAANAQGK